MFIQPTIHHLILIIWIVYRVTFSCVAFCTCENGTDLWKLNKHPYDRIIVVTNFTIISHAFMVGAHISSHIVAPAAYNNSFIPTFDTPIAYPCIWIPAFPNLLRVRGQKAHETAFCVGTTFLERHCEEGRIRWKWLGHFQSTTQEDMRDFIDFYTRNHKIEIRIMYTCVYRILFITASCALVGVRFATRKRLCSVCSVITYYSMLSVNACITAH